MDPIWTLWVTLRIFPFVTLYGFFCKFFSSISSRCMSLVPGCQRSCMEVGLTGGMGRGQPWRLDSGGWLPPQQTNKIQAWGVLEGLTKFLKSFQTLSCTFTVRARKLKLYGLSSPLEHVKSTTILKSHNWFSSVKWGVCHLVDIAKGWS